jgi:hypothetical protein
MSEPYTQPAAPNAGTCLSQSDGSYKLTFTPDCPERRIEFVWGSERPPNNAPFVRDITHGVIESDVPSGDIHEWCCWQFHAPDEAALGTTYPLMSLYCLGGFLELRITHNYSAPYDCTKVTAVKIAEGLPIKSGTMSRWRIEGKFGQDGFCRVRRDGVLVADYEGPVGVPMIGRPYFKSGIYKWYSPPIGTWLGCIQAKIKFDAAQPA